MIMHDGGGYSYQVYRVGGGVGHICLNLNFWKIFPDRFTRDFTTTDKKIQKYLISYVQNILTENPLRFNVEPVLK